MKHSLGCLGFRKKDHPGAKDWHALHLGSGGVDSPLSIPGPPPTTPSQLDHLPSPGSFYCDPQAFPHGSVCVHLPPPEAPPCPTLSVTLDLRTHSKVTSPLCWAFPDLLWAPTGPSTQSPLTLSSNLLV